MHMTKLNAVLSTKRDRLVSGMLRVSLGFGCFAVVAGAIACSGDLGEAGGNGPSAGVDQAAGPGSGPNQTNSQAATSSKQASGNQTTGSPGPDSATLTWDANSEADLAGYKVYHSQESQMYTLGMPEADIPAGTMTHVSANLSSGRHYFAVTAYDSNGNESALSMEAFKDIP